MNSASCSFVPPLPLKGCIPHAFKSNHRQVPCALQPPNSNPSLYSILGLNRSELSSITVPQIRKAYLKLAKTVHPDVSSASSSAFDQISRAYTVLTDPELRAVYDQSGQEGLTAIESIKTRAEQIRDSFSSMPGEQLEFLSDTGELIGGLLSSASEKYSFDPASASHEDACPRSVEEAIYNIQFHPNQSVRYYGLWWIYKFKVTAAEAALINVLQTSDDRTALGGYGLRRRAAMGLGSVASAPTGSNQAAVLALSDALRSTDYFLRYRSAEALTSIAQRFANVETQLAFPATIVSQLKSILKEGRTKIEAEAESASGFKQQESLFDLEKLEPSVRERLEAIFKERRENEQRSRRTTMTPQLGVAEIDSRSDQPYEWLLKAVSAICVTQNSHYDDELVHIIQSYTSNSIPLVRYAAYKALYVLTREERHAEQIVKALEYGVEHHYSQRVLIRDLGDVGYSKGAEAVARCPMVENSFKILALKNMLAKQNHNTSNPDVRSVLEHMDSLL